MPLGGGLSSFARKARPGAGFSHFCTLAYHGRRGAYRRGAKKALAEIRRDHVTARSDPKGGAGGSAPVDLAKFPNIAKRDHAGPCIDGVHRRSPAVVMVMVGRAIVLLGRPVHE
jgi:hypothetical protein